MRAEALAMVNSSGNKTEIEGLINQIRDRVSVGMPHVTDAEITNAGGLLNVIKHERRVELAFEGHRFWDLRRWGLGTTVLNGTHMKGVKPMKVGDKFEYQLVDCDGGSTRVYLEKYNRFPIPLGELQQNTSCEQFDEWK